MILEWLDAKIHLISVLWLFPILFMFHDFEEILTVEKWTKQNKEHVLTALPQSIRKYFYSSFKMTTLHFAQDVFWVYLSITAATILAVIFSFYYIFLVFLAIFFGHVFTHIGQAIFLKKYTPGVITSIFLVLPYSLYAYYRLLKEHIINGGDILWSILGICIAVPILLLFLVSKRNRATKNKEWFNPLQYNS
ncbi:HXXEE domain-containing protein [Bacillus methanolicus]|uniref:HXXEE domain-containing protein n=1 Tax=Bacillus methanolicus TaxID=1471 RepID=UPI00237FE441|nr:HXXEE domain-containing protein [Bacillus methanolicus]